MAPGPGLLQAFLSRRAWELGGEPRHPAGAYAGLGTAVSGGFSEPRGDAPTPGSEVCGWEGKTRAVHGGCVEQQADERAEYVQEGSMCGKTL